MTGHATTTSVAKPSRAQYALLIVKKKPEAKTASIVIVYREWRSKWLRLTCLCKRPRKDGTCWKTDRALEQMTDFGRSITRRIEHPEAS